MTQYYELNEEDKWFYRNVSEVKAESRGDKNILSVSYVKVPERNITRSIKNFRARSHDKVFFRRMYLKTYKQRKKH